MSRVVLRRWRLDDAQWYAARSQDPEILRWTTERRGLTADQVRAAIAALPPESLALAAVDAETGELIGNAAVAIKDGRAEPSYWVAAEARGRGLATEVLTELTRRCRDAGHQRVEVVVHVDNAASKRVAQKAGFEPVGFESHAELGRCVRYRHSGR